MLLSLAQLLTCERALAQEVVIYDGKNRVTPSARIFVTPKYPAQFIEQQIAGYLDMEFGLRRDGSVISPKITEGDLPPAFSEATLDVAKLWIFHTFYYGVNCTGFSEDQRYVLRVWFEFKPDGPHISIAQPGSDLHVLHSEPMIYPRSAVRRYIDRGCVLAKGRLSETGEVLTVSVLESRPPGVFDATVTEGLSRYRFAKVDGKPDKQPLEFTIQVNFELRLQQ